MMKTIITVLLTLFVNSAVASASETSHVQAVERFFEVTDAQKVLQGAQDAVLESQLKTNICLRPYEATIHDFYRETLGWNNFKDEMLKIYMREFTESEIKEITKFYETPAGKKMLEKSPKLMLEGSQIGYRLAGEKQNELQKMLEEAKKTIDPESIPPECRLEEEQKPKVNKE